MRHFYERLGTVFAWLGFVCLTIGVIPVVVYLLNPDAVLESRQADLAARAASTRFFQIGCEQLEQVGTVSGLPQAGATTFDQNKCHLGVLGWRPCVSSIARKIMAGFSVLRPRNKQNLRARTFSTYIWSPTTLFCRQ